MIVVHVSVSAHGCGNFIDNVVLGTFLITLFTRKLNGDMSSLIKLFPFFRCVCVCVCCQFVVTMGKGCASEMAVIIGTSIKLGTFYSC